MKTMRTIINIMVPAAVCLLALAGCARENVLEESEVRFTVSSDNASTRTAFSGDMATVGSQLRERVDWVEGDRITIWSDKAEKLDGSHSSVYAVTGVQATGDNDLISRASIDNANPGGGLRWKDGGETHTFFAAYGADAAISAAGNVQTVTGGAIPADQTSLMTWSGNTGTVDMDYAYMVGVLQSAYASTVVLPFRQMYTAFEFTIENSGSAAVPLSSFGLSSTSTKMAGGFTVAYASSLADLTVTPAADAVNALSLTLSSVSVPAGGSVTFTILALGLTQRNLTVSLAGESFGTRTLALKSAADTWVDFTASTKHRITITLPAMLTAESGDLTWEQTVIGEPISWLDNSYVLGVRDPYDLTYKGGISETGGVISYRLVEGNPVAAAWEVLGYYPTRTDAENNQNAYSGYPSWVNSYPASGSGAASVTGQSVAINYKASAVQTEEKTVTAEAINSEIASSTFGLGSSPDCYFNLANPDNKISDEIVESANSYIINGPGYYRIPMVMGNGVKANALNTAAYTKVDGKDADNFVNHADQVVSSPLLQKSSGTYTLTNAYVIWESKDGLIETSGSDYSIPNVDSSTSPFTLSTGTLASGDDVYWLNFRVAAGEQGNAVIAVTDGTNVLWSYHIWVTNYVCRNEVANEDITVMLNPNRATFATYPGKQDKSYTLMPLNLGWLYEGENIKATEYASNTMYVKIRQTGSSKTAVMEVKRPGHHVVTQYGLGNSPYYQWGRKDPFMPVATAAGGRNKEFSNTANGSTGVTLGTGIKNPDQFYSNTNASIAWFKDAPAANLWCADINQNYDPTNGSAQTNDVARNHQVVKTIYDPCPAGYSVPTYGAFSFRTDDRTEGHTSTYNTSTGAWTPPATVYCDGYNNRYGQQAGFYGYGNWNMETYVHVLGIKDGYAPDSFYGFRFYANTQVEYEKPSGWSYTVPSAINLGEPYIYLPAVGYRSYYSGSLLLRDTTLPAGAPYGSDGVRGYYWAAMENDNSQGLSFDIEHYWTSDQHSHYINVKNWSHFPLADGCSIRPMQNDY